MAPGKKSLNQVLRNVSQQETFKIVPKITPRAKLDTPNLRPILSNSDSRLAQSFGVATDVVKRGLDLNEEQLAKKAQFEAQEGSIDAVRFKNELRSLEREYINGVGTDNQLTPEKLGNRLQDLEKKHLEGKSKAFQNSFTPQAHLEEERFRGRIDEINFNFMKQEARNGLRMLFEDRTNTLLSVISGVEEDRMSNLITSDLETANSFNESVGKERGRIGEIVRNLLTEAQQSNPDIPKDEITETVVKLLADKAEELGSPELLDFADIRDKSGISLSDTQFKDIIEQGKARATRRRVVNQDNIRKELERREKIEVQTYFNEATLEISDLASNPASFDTADFNKRQLRLENNLIELSRRGLVPNKQFAAQLELIRSLNAEVPLTSNPTVKSSLMSEIIEGRATLEDVNQLSQFLTVEDRLKMARLTEEWGDEKKSFEFSNKDILKSALQSFKIDEVSRLTVTDFAVREQNAKGYFMRLANQWVEENPDQVIPFDVETRLVKQARDRFFPNNLQARADNPEKFRTLDENKKKAAEELKNKL